MCLYIHIKIKVNKIQTLVPQYIIHTISVETENPTLSLKLDCLAKDNH